MHIPFPERILYSRALIFACALAGVQLLERTNPYFTGLCFCYILVATTAFNIAGGMRFPSGVFIGSNAIISLVFPLVVKAILGEPADTRLRAGAHTIEVYLCGMVAMLAAAIFSQHFRTRNSLMAKLLPIRNLQASYYGNSVVAVLVTFTFFTVGVGGNGSFTALLAQINHFPTLALLLGVVYTIQKTHGKRSASWPLTIGIAIASIGGGLLTLSKEAILTPVFCWVLVAAIYRYRLHLINAFVLAAAIYLSAAYMTPVVAVARGYQGNPDSAWGSNVQLTAYLLANMNETRDLYNEAFVDPSASIGYYNTRLGLLDRMEFLAVDSALIQVADRDGPMGYEPIKDAFANFVPHIFWRDKPTGFFGNLYGRQIEIISSLDIYTGVSFGPTADAYREGLMFGVLVIEPLLLAFGFFLLDSLIGDTRSNPVGLIIVALLLRVSSEGMLTGMLGLLAQPMYATLFAAFLCAYIFPILGRVFGRTTPAAPPPAETALPAAG